MIEQIKLKSKIKNVLKNEDEITLLVHSDLMQGFKVPFVNRNDFLVAHYNELTDLHQKVKIWMPTFNYDFFKDQVFSLKNSKSQVGVLSEYFRTNVSDWRSSVPGFSFSGLGDVPLIGTNNSIIDPFGLESNFNYLYENKAWLMHYGSSFSSSTILHYAERISQKMTYRYDKFFKGSILNLENEKSEVMLKYHVRPFGRHLGYDWNKIEKDLFKEDILIEFEEEKTKVLLCKINKLIDFWIFRLNVDPYYLIDEESKLWIVPQIDKLGRSFLITDFE